MTVREIMAQESFTSEDIAFLMANLGDLTPKDLSRLGIGEHIPDTLVEKVEKVVKKTVQKKTK